MAEYLASIFGTEKDKVNCSFFFKTGKITFWSVRSHILIFPTQAPALTGIAAAGSTTSRPSLRLCFSPTSTSTLRTPPRRPMAPTWPMWPTRRCKNTTTTFSRTSSWSARINMARWSNNLSRLRCLLTKTFPLRLKRWTCATISVIIWLVMCMSSSRKKRWVIWTLNI